MQPYIYDVYIEGTGEVGCVREGLEVCYVFANYSVFKQ